MIREHSKIPGKTIHGCELLTDSKKGTHLFIVISWSSCVLHLLKCVSRALDDIVVSDLNISVTSLPFCVLASTCLEVPPTTVLKTGDVHEHILHRKRYVTKLRCIWYMVYNNSMRQWNGINYMLSCFLCTLRSR